MLTITLTVWLHMLVFMKWRWISWVVLYLLVSGSFSVVTVDQPPVISTTLGHDVTLPCRLNLSSDEKMMTPPVLYWVYVTHTASPKLWLPSGTYNGRVDLLDNNMKSLDKSILLKSVQWADSGKYLCKLSVTTERDKSFRKKGNETLLLVYGNIIFNLSDQNDSSLRCEVNVTREPGFVLSIVHDGYKLLTAGSAQGDAVAATSYVTLSETIHLMDAGKYECQLHLNEDLIQRSTFHYHLPVTGEGGDAGKNVSTTCSTIVSGLAVFPQPWFLYVALLLVPVTFLLGLLTARVMRRN